MASAELRLAVGASFCGLHVLLALLIVASPIECLNILEHTIEPSKVENCSNVVLTCKLDTLASAAVVWWTFNSGDVAKMFNANMTIDPDDDRAWRIELTCVTVEHSGNYACNAHTLNETGVVFRREAKIEVYGLSLEAEKNETRVVVGDNATLTCLVTVTALPNATVQWFKDKVRIDIGNESDVDRDFGSKLRKAFSLDFWGVTLQDNGTYECQATNSNETLATVSQDLVVLELPEVSFNVTSDTTSSVLFTWQVSQGSLHTTTIHLQMKNISTNWSDVDTAISANTTSYRLTSLVPGNEYAFRLGARNEVGFSGWVNASIRMPPDVPPKISWIHILATTNETLVFGWRKPEHDNGAQITYYNVRLKKADVLISQNTSNVTIPTRTNYMYVFVTLQSGESYSFQVQACNAFGCGNWSDILNGTTSDGTADPPRNVEIRCERYIENGENSSVVVTWDLPDNSRGIILNYNVTLTGKAQYRNEDGQSVEDNTFNFYLVKSTELEFNTTVKHNTEYTAQVCTINRSGCGLLSTITTNTVCTSPPSVPSDLPLFRMQRMNDAEDCRQLKLSLRRASERNGFIQCYRVIIIRLQKGETLSSLPTNPHNLNLSTHKDVHKDGGHGAYIAEAFNSEKFVSEVVIGDNQFSLCKSESIEAIPHDNQVRNRRTIMQTFGSKDIKTVVSVYDGMLTPSTNYTGFVEVRVRGPNGTILSKQSPYFVPIQTGSLPTPPPTENPVAVIFGVISGIILVILVLVLTLFIIRHQHGHPYVDNGERLGLTTLILRTIHRNGHLPRGKGGHLSKIPRLGPLASDELPTAFVERHLDSDLLFQSEFEALPENFKDRTTHASDSPENLCKNRYPDIKAFDQTRVRLPLLEGLSGSDYINANFIEGYKGRKSFICAQGPLDRTVTDFWRMIWEHRVTVVVMLTGIEEHGKVKCAQYWSDDSPKEIEKLFIVSVISTKKYSDYVVRRFQVEHTRDGLTEEREVLHFHFVMWKDFLAPEQPSWLLRFIKRVNEHYCSDRGPLLVHCSAGVGRTGTFVAVDSLLQQLEEENQVDIYAHVCNLRRQRNFLVQSLKQYIFVYRALMEHAQFGDTEVEIRHLRDHYELLKEKVGDTDKAGLQLEFEKLSDVIEDPKTCCVGTMDMNIGKNRYDLIIPYDMNRVILPPSPSRDHSSYINASFIQGYDRSLSFIITQDPLECTVSEFWRMVKEQNITTLVMLSEIGEGQSKCQQYWPEDGDEKESDYVKIKCERMENKPYYTKREFSVTNTKNNDNHTLTQFQFLEWPVTAGVVPESTLGLVILIEHAQHNQEKYTNSGPITVHCSGGGDRSSVYVTLSVLIQQLKAEERVDIFQAARYTRSQRHCMLQTLAQYDFLYRGLMDYISSRNLCDMGDTQL